MIRIIKTSGYEKIFLSIFGAGSLLFFWFFYNNHLYQKEQLQLFELTFRHLTGAISHHGGIAIYISEFLTQFFRLPFAGAAIITLLLILLQRLTKRVILIATGAPPLIFLTFLPALSYWIILLNDFYSLSGLTGLLISLAGSLVYLNIRDAGKRGVAGILLVPVIYWLAGAAYLVLVLIIVAAELVFRISRDKKRDPVNIPIFITTILLALLIPLAAREFLFKETVLQSFISEAYYRISIFFPIPLILLFAFFPLAVLLQNLINSKMTEKQLSAIDLLSFPVLFLFLAWGIKNTGNFKDEREMAYDNLVFKEKWDLIIKKAEKKHPSDRLSMIAVNLALAKTGELSSKMFRFDQEKNILFGEYEKRGMTPFLACEPYYHIGLFNFAQMFAMETIESTPDAKFPSRSFKRVAETFIINGQYDIARKYLIPLSHTLFYRKWASESLALLNNEERINAHPYWSSMRRLKLKNDFYYNPGQMDISLQMLLISNPGNRLAFEYLMAYYLLQKDLDGFLKYLPLAYSLNYNELPLAWQEAAVYIETRVPQVPAQLTGFAIREDVISRIRSYAQLFSAARQDTVKIKEEFGNTYWYYLHFK
jgi:hypothetical protein